MKCIFAGSAQLRAFSVFILFITSLAFPAPLIVPEPSNQLYLTIGTGLPNPAAASLLYSPQSWNYLQCGVGEFLLKDGCWKADISAGFVVRDVGMKNSLFLAGIGYSYYYLKNFFLFEEKSAYQQIETHDFVTLSFNYAKFFQLRNRLGWTAGLALNASSTAFLPEVRAGLILRVL